ncbi:sialin-like [Paramacrobiotus metropolitanus]|uniref:sialin-like n=1 Tax=Paramacrobiotus metropolitanus TaxID=2943436 RepID=UPI002445F3DD|nr:sialin-like [Paramacrobiotus metropolitanus]
MEKYNKFLKALRIPGTDWLPARYAMSMLCFFGFFNLYALRVNLSVGIVAMVNRTAVAELNKATIPTTNASFFNSTASNIFANQSKMKNSDECPYPSADNSTKPGARGGDIVWTNKIQGMILSSFFWGYICTQLIGGWLSSQLGAKHPFGFSIFASAILSFFIPMAARYHYGAVLVIRVIQGFTEGFSYPAMHALLGKWAPPLERSRMAAISYSGVQTGTVITMILCGVLAENLGWESIFYFFGALGVIWYAFWLLYASSTPESHPRISEEELDYILTAIGSQRGVSPPVPWKAILRSVPVWTVCVGAFGHNWGFYTLLTNIPSYLSKVLHFSIQNNGFISSLPYLATIPVMTLAGYVADVLRTRKILTQTNIRKSFHFIGQLLPSSLLILLGFVGCDWYAAITVLVLAVGLDGIASSGYQFNHVDISPTYAGILMGLSNTVSSIPGMIGPSIVGVITDGPSGNSVVAWRLVFYITAAVSMSCAIFFAIFASGELGSWEVVRPKEQKQMLEDSPPVMTDIPLTNKRASRPEVTPFGIVRGRKSLIPQTDSTVNFVDEEKKVNDV